MAAGTCPIESLIIQNERPPLLPLLRGLCLKETGRAIASIINLTTTTGAYDCRPDCGDIANSAYPLLLPKSLPMEDKKALCKAVNVVLTMDVVVEATGDYAFPEFPSPAEIAVLNAMRQEYEWEHPASGKPYLENGSVIELAKYLKVVSESNGGAIFAESIGASPSIAEYYNHVTRLFIDFAKARRDWRKGKPGNYLLICAMHNNQLTDIGKVTEEMLKTEELSIIEKINDALKCAPTEGSDSLTEEDNKMLSLMPNQLQFAQLFRYWT